MKMNVRFKGSTAVAKKNAIFCNTQDWCNRFLWNAGTLLPVHDITSKMTNQNMATSWITLEEYYTQCVTKSFQYLLKHLLGVRLGCWFLPPLNSRRTLWSTSSTSHCQLIQCHHGIWRGLSTCHAYNKKLELPNLLQMWDHRMKQKYMSYQGLTWSADHKVMSTCW